MIRRLLLFVTVLLFGCGAVFGEDFGWEPDPQATEAFVRTIPILYAADVKTLVAEDDGTDVLLYRALVPCLERHGLTSWLKERSGKKVVRAYDQGRTGSCVGNATAAAVSVLNAVEVFFKLELQEFTAMHSADAMYGLSRGSFQWTVFSCQNLKTDN
jgi:hypothetical protein